MIYYKHPSVNPNRYPFPLYEHCLHLRTNIAASIIIY